MIFGPCRNFFVIFMMSCDNEDVLYVGLLRLGDMLGGGAADGYYVAYKPITLFM